MLRASELARVPNVTFGPYLGVRDDGALVAWAPLDGTARRFELVPLSTRGRPRGPVVQAGPAPEAIGLVVVRPLGSGYVVAYTAKETSGEGLRALCVGADGRRIAQSAVTALPGRALWLESMPFGAGALTLYAVQRKETKHAELWAAVLDGDCNLSTPALAVKAADAWQAVKLGGAALIASMQGARSAGDVSATVVDATGVVKSSAVVASNVKADIDLDAVAIGDRVVIAWTNKKPLDPRIETALVGPDAQLLRPPAALTPPRGEQTLIRLVAPAQGSDTAYVAWERLDVRSDSGRHVRLAPLTSDGRLRGPEVELEYVSSDAGMPEMAAAPGGLAVVTLAAVCRRDAACGDDSEVAPTFVRFDEQMNVVASEPLRLDSLAGGRAELGFGIGCTRDGCFSISALSRVPAPVFATELEAVSNSWRAPVVPSRRGPLAVLEHETLARTDSVASFTTNALQGRDYLAYVTSFDPTTPWVRLKKPAPDGRLEPLRAKVVLSAIAPESPPREPQIISLRAESRAGVALVPSARNKDEALVAWAGVDAGTPQVFLSLIGKGGSKVAQRMLTRKKGELGDVTAVAVDDGWVVAWIDERSGDPEVYAAKVDAKLNRTSAEQRITSAPGAASDLALAYDGAHVRAAWADARGAELSGHSDIYTALLNPRDASRDGDEQRVAATAAHSFGPALRASGDGFALAWIERGEGAEPGRIAVAHVDAKGPPAAPALLSAAGAPRAVNITCQGQTCRLAALSDDEDGVKLVAATWQGQPPSELTVVTPLAGGAAANARPAFRGDDILYVDASNDEARIRRVKLQW